MRFLKKWWWNQTASMALLCLALLTCWTTMTFAATGPSVNVMPSGDADESAYTWAGNSISVWGNVKWGDSTSGTYSWNFGDGSSVASGAVTNAKNIAVNHAYANSNTYEATLTVTDGNGLSDSATVRIKVLPSVTKSARINLAIEKGLKWLYLQQRSDGGIWTNNYYSSTGAETASAVNAFENKNHKPCTKDLNNDGIVDTVDRAIWEKGRIYAETVHKGLDYLISTLATVNLGSGSTYDSNGNSVAVADNYYPTGSYRGPYKIGMYMMALVAAGDKNSGAPELLATTGPTGVIGKTYRKLVEDMVDYCDYSQYHDYPAYGGGWIYGPGEGYGDNSASQWPAIGMEAAQTAWGVPVRQAIKDLNFAWINYSQYYTGYDSNAWYYGALGYQGLGTGVARTASGICQLSFQGKLKNDPRILAAAKFLGSYESNMNNWEYGRTSYNMYAISKAARIAKIDTNSDGIGDTYSEIQMLNGWDWYDAVSTELLGQQYTDGHWYNWSYSYTVMDTAWAVEVLTKNVFTLRPIADMTASPNPTPALSSVEFDISGSHHQDSTKNLTQWKIDVNGDGTYDLSGTFPVLGPITYAGYPEKTPPQDYTVNAKLQIADNSTPQEVGEIVVPVTISTTKVPPVAKPGGPYNGVVGTPVTFDGSASYSPNPGGSIIKYEWDLDGNGSFETNGGSSATVQKAWIDPYVGNVGLKVTDNDGLTGSSQTYAQVFVVDLWPESYLLVSQKRISTFVYEYTYKFSMRNRGNGEAKNVKCTLVTYPAQFQILDGNVSFGDIAGGAVKSSGSDTFKFRQDRRFPATDNQLRWKLEYDYIGSDGNSHHQTFADFPLR